MPCDIVRLPWGSMSTQRTRWPFSANATATFSVVVVLATPPFWLANAMTLACWVTRCSDARRGNPCATGYSQPRAGFLPGLCHLLRVLGRPVGGGAPDTLPPVAA